MHKIVVERAGTTVAAAVRAAIEGLPWSRARDLCRSGRVRVDGEVVLDAAQRLAPGATVEVDPTAPRRRAGVLAPEAIVHLDREVVIVRKPPGMLTVPFDEGDKDTLVDVTRAALRRRGRERRDGQRYDPMLGVVHRLDKDTTGLLVFARTLDAKRQLAQQFRAHTVERRYVAIVHGRARDATYDTTLVRDRGDGLRGSWGALKKKSRGEPPPDAQRAITHLRVLERAARATLVECRLETGRQHQIRIHVSEAGNPLAGERVYVREHSGAHIDAPRPMLHAKSLGFVHPRTGEAIRFEEPPPEDFVALWARLSSER